MFEDLGQTDFDDERTPVANIYHTLHILQRSAQQSERNDVHDSRVLDTLLYFIDPFNRRNEERRSSKPAPMLTRKQSGLQSASLLAFWNLRNCAIQDAPVWSIQKNPRASGRRLSIDVGECTACGVFGAVIKVWWVPQQSWERLLGLQTCEKARPIQILIQKRSVT